MIGSIAKNSGISSAAKTLEKYLRELSQQNRGSATFSNLPLDDQLIDVWSEATERGWDGERSKPIDPGTLTIVRDFVLSLPREYQTPEISPEPDGHVNLEWYRNKRRMLSVSVDPDGRLHWAALLGNEDPRGSCEFQGEAPRTLLHILRRVCH